MQPVGPMGTQHATTLSQPLRTNADFADDGLLQKGAGEEVTMVQPSPQPQFREVTATVRGRLITETPSEAWLPGNGLIGSDLRTSAR